MTTELTIFDSSTGNKPLTMSSREIAELTGVRHDNVKRTIEKCVSSGVFGLPQIEENLTYEEDTNIPHKSKVYRLDKRTSMIVVAQLCPEFTAKIIDRWQELESAVQSKAFAALPDFTKPAVAARAWADQVEARERAEYQAAELASENAKLLPKAKVADTIASAEGLHSISTAAKILGTGQKRLFSRLRNAGILNSHNIPYQRFVERGYFTSRESTYRAGDVDHVYPQTFVTGKGISWLSKNMKKDSATDTLVQ